MLDTRFPRIPGDVGDAETWPLPVRFKVVTGADTTRIMGKDSDSSLVDPFIEGACAVERGGVRSITTSYGFLAIFQQGLAAATSPDIRLPQPSGGL